MTVRTAESLLSSFFYLGAARVAVVCMNLAATSRTAHALGTANFGINSFAISYLAYFIIVVNLGFETFLTREIAFDNARLHQLVSSVITMRLLLAAATGILLFASLSWLPLTAVGQVVVLVQGINLFTSAIGLTCIYQGLQRMRVVASREFMASLVNVIGILWFVHSPDDLVLAACISVGTQLAVNLTILAHYVTDYGFPRIRLPRSGDLRLARQSMTYFWSLVMITITYNTHIVLLGLMRNDTEVGLFTAGWKLFIFAITVPNLIATLFMPRIANRMRRTTEHDSSAQLLWQTMILCALPISMFGSALIPQILTVLFGPTYLAASRMVALLLLNSLVVSLNIGFGTWLTAVGRQGALLRMLALGAGVGVLLNLVLITLLGGEGAALATLIDEMAILAMLLRTCHATLNRNALGFALRCLIAVTPAAIAAYGIPFLPVMAGADLAALTVGGTGATVVYLLILHALGINLVRFAKSLHQL